jgi:hypothetical protein
MRGQRRLKGDYQARVHLDKMVLLKSGGEAGLGEQWPNTLNESLMLKGEY